MGLIAFGPGARRGRCSAARAQGQCAPPAPPSGPGPEQEAAGECALCGLPFGSVGYAAEEERERLHAECAAQLVLQDARKAERDREASEAAEKRGRRAEHGIGWAPDRAPGSAALAERLGCPGQACLALRGDAVRLVPTEDPAARINLEYLLLALRVRRVDGREPLFSLDPCQDAGCALDHAEARWQVKRFEPEWLGSTSVGDVMFQADVHLKELSMGEYPQPVIGMQSCLDLCMEEAHAAEWNAREWFVVRKAAVCLSEDGVLIPRVEMGVEAREQVKGPEGLEDAPMTRPDHPLVRYAEAFTRRFDLIAERKSVVHHLRELARAAVAARFILDSGARLDDTLARLGEELAEELAAGEPGPRLVPQLWNRRLAELLPSEGAEPGLRAGLRCVYGGVQLGLDRFQLGAVSVSGVSTRVAPLSAARHIDQPNLVPFKAPPAAAARGVDLNLDRFQLSAALPEARAGAGCAAGKAFWQQLRPGVESAFADTDARFLRELFNPRLSDRRDEGDLFVPPDISADYVSRLSALMEEEAQVRRRRADHFLSEGFAAQRPTSLFPAAWSSSIGTADGHALLGFGGDAPPTASLHLRSDYKADSHRFKRFLEFAVPLFDKTTEDGMRFRIYQVGSLQVRTTQEYGCEEMIGAFFSSHPAPQARDSPDREVMDVDRVARVTLYVEAADAPAATGQPRPLFFAVVETEAGARVLTEKRGGQAVWAASPAQLEARVSLGRVLGRVDVAGMGVTVGDVRLHGPGTGRCEGECHARAVLAGAVAPWGLAWARLPGRQRLAAELLGVGDAAAWMRGAGSLGLEWCELSEAQRAAARELGLDEGAWGQLRPRAEGAGHWRPVTAPERGPPAVSLDTVA